VVVDAITDRDLLTIAVACRSAKLITGSSGIARGLPRNFIRSGRAYGTKPHVNPINGSEVVLAGSCSNATRNQIAVHAVSHPVLAIDVAQVVEKGMDISSLIEFVHQNSGKAPLIYSSMLPKEVERVRRKFSQREITSALDNLFTVLAKKLLDSGLRRFVVAGGETSGAVVSGLGITALQIGPEIDPGVPVVTDRNGTIGLALKSGNFGAPDFFANALSRMSQEGRTDD
jgi:3-dehydrotetronate 4-kinase